MLIKYLGAPHALLACKITYIYMHISFFSEQKLNEFMGIMERNRAQWSINKENFGALLKSVIGNLKSIIGPGLNTKSTAEMLIKHLVKLLKRN